MMNLIAPPFVSVQTAMREAVRVLEESAIPCARLEAELLLSHALGIERIDLYKFPDRRLSGAEMGTYEKLIRLRSSGVPTAYLRGKKEFFSLTFEVGPGVLIPRADTELLVEEAAACFAPDVALDLLDLGTGSGALMVAALRHYRNARGIAVDISESALAYARVNALKHQVDRRVVFTRGDLFEGVPPGSRFDLILSNPPYIPTTAIASDLRFEPREALDGGEDGMNFYRRILADAWRFMKPGGFLLLEIGYPDAALFAREIAKWEEAYFPPVFKKDLAGEIRAVVLKRKPE